MSIPAHKHVYWIGKDAPGPLGQVPYATELEVVREKENEKFTVKIKKPSAAVPAQSFDAFRDELYFE